MIKFCFSFLFCTVTLCGAFLFCMRVWFLQKVEKIDPVNVIKPQRKLNALQRELREEKIKEILDRG